MAYFDDIPELAELHSSRSLIRVPEEQNVPMTDRVRAIIDTAEFQRLNDISQLGLVSCVYPGARHTRFEHALGVYHNALKYVQQLSGDERFRDCVSSKSVELLLVASLLHDLGHWPFCHPIEDLGIEGLIPHEAHAGRFLESGTELRAVLTEQWHLDPVEVLEILTPKTKKPEWELLRSILSGPIDVDKMDYLDRDSLHCGVPYGRNFDRQRLIQSLILNEAGDGLAIHAKGKTAAELMVFARYVMFSEVYWHHAVRSATSMFARAFYELHHKLDLVEMFGSSDAEMVAGLREAAVGKPCEPLLEGLFGSRRNLYKRAAEFGHEDQAEVYRCLAGRPFSETSAIAKQLSEILQEFTAEPISPTDVLIDAPPPHREVEFRIDVFFPKQQEYRPLQRVSPVIDALATSQFDDWVKRVRVFIAPRLKGALEHVEWDKQILKAIDGTIQNL